MKLRFKCREHEIEVTPEELKKNSKHEELKFQSGTLDRNIVFGCCGGTISRGIRCIDYFICPVCGDKIVFKSKLKNHDIYFADCTEITGSCYGPDRKDIFRPAHWHRGKYKDIPNEKDNLKP